MDNVIGFADRLGSRLAGHARHQPHGPASFTRRDCADLQAWSVDGRRAVICTSEMGVFAMLYADEMPWASWGVVRQGRQVLLWDCVSLADIGHFACMADALAAMPDFGMADMAANVLLFSAAAERRAQ